MLHSRVSSTLGRNPCLTHTHTHTHARTHTRTHTDSHARTPLHPLIIHLNPFFPPRGAHIHNVLLMHLMLALKAQRSDLKWLDVAPMSGSGGLKTLWPTAYPTARHHLKAKTTCTNKPYAPLTLSLHPPRPLPHKSGLEQNILHLTGANVASRIWIATLPVPASSCSLYR